MAKAKGNETQMDAWDNGEYGLEEAFVKVTNAAEALEVDGALDLKMISIRLQKDLIEKIKVVAKYHGIGYQSLIRNLLNKFVRSELMQIALELQNKEKIEAKVKDHPLFGTAQRSENRVLNELEEIRSSRLKS
jgi:predicted DNA binding CopG/RHH family protein